MVQGQLEQTRLLRKRFAFLARRGSVERMVRLPLPRQLRRIQARRKSAVAAASQISARTLRRMRGVAERMGADAESLTILRRAAVLAARGDRDTLAAMAPVQPAPPRTVGPTPEPPPPEPLPDLVIDRVFLTSDTGWEWNIVVRNTGLAAAGDSLTGLTQPGLAEVLIKTPGLAPGESVTVKTECPYGSVDSATVRADATGVVVESDESNNGGGAETGGGTSGRCRYP
jgi:hypothetical protein